jgi:hypothetical protein
MQILHCIDRYLANRAGEVKKLKAPLIGFRLRCGDYRVFFDTNPRAPSTSPPFATAGKPTVEPSSPASSDDLRNRPSLKSTFVYSNVHKSRHFFHNLTPFSSPPVEIIGDLAGFPPTFSTVFLQECFVNTRREPPSPADVHPPLPLQSWITCWAPMAL